MNFVKQTIALATLAMTLSSGLALTASQADAQIVRRGRTPAPSVQPQGLTRLAAPSVSSNWQGNIRANDDDALSSIALQMNGNGSVFQGTWQLQGANENLDEGNLTASKQGNTITIALAGFNGNQPLVMTGTVSANGTVMSGQVAAPNSNLVFYFTKN